MGPGRLWQGLCLLRSHSVGVGTSEQVSWEKAESGSDGGVRTRERRGREDTTRRTHLCNPELQRRQPRVLPADDLVTHMFPPQDLSIGVLLRGCLCRELEQGSLQGAWGFHFPILLWVIWAAPDPSHSQQFEVPLLQPQSFRPV